jgi:hypothetical protein
MGDLANLDQTSPGLTGGPQTPQADVPLKSLTWQEVLKAIQGFGGAAPRNDIGGLTEGLGSNANAGIPLYSRPLQAAPMQDEPQKQTTQADVEKYSQLLSGIFG